MTLDGEVIDPHGVVTGGSRESAVAGVLEQKREIRELEEVDGAPDADMRGALARQVERKQRRRTSARAGRSGGGAARDEMALYGLRKDVDRVAEELRSHEMRRQQLATQAADLGARPTTTSADSPRPTPAWRATRARRRRRRAGGGAARATAALADAVDVAIGELTTLKVAAAQAEERRQNARLTLDRLRADRAEEEARAARLEATLADDDARAATLRADAARLRDEAELWQAEAEARARAHGERQGALEERQMRAGGGRCAAAHRARRGRAHGADAVAAGAAQPGSGLRRTSLEEQVLERYRDVELAAVVHEYHLRALFSDEEERRATELRGLIERMGEINLTAIEESEELQKRFDFLTTQKADLESAIAQLETAIEQHQPHVAQALPRDVRRGQRQVRGGVPAHVRRRARPAWCSPTTSDMLETGIEIVANPPGKKVGQNIELLSGGEKALTAVSLLFAIFLVKPSPFCVLDEVDAPLDEANVGRFNQVVREMTDRSQFILITHNRRTMEIADGCAA